MAIFADVVRCRSFSRAAQRHGVSQSAASQRVSQLEKLLGVKLLDRSVRPPALTEPGRVFFEGCADILQRYEALTQRVGEAAQAGAQARPIRVMAIYSAGIAWLGRVRDGFADVQPTAAVTVEYGSPTAVVEAVEQGIADVGIVSFPQLLPALLYEGAPGTRTSAKESRLAWRSLRDEAMAVVCPVEHPWAREPAVSARHLEQVGQAGPEMLGFDGQLPVGQAVRAYLAQHGVTPTITHTFDNLDTLKSAVLSTGRPAILPRRCVAAEIAAGRLAAVALRPAMVRPIAALYRTAPGASHDEPPSPLVAFLDFLAAHAETDAGETLALPRPPLLAGHEPLAAVPPTAPPNIGAA